MNWTTKAKLQKAVAVLPSAISYPVYYWLQRHFGALRTINPMHRLSSAIHAWRRVKEHDGDPERKNFLEIGTGYSPAVPMAYWLMGARKVITLDLNPYLKAELTKSLICYVQENRESVEKLFGPLLDRERFQQLLRLRTDEFALSAFLELCGITYIAPSDATETGLESSSIDIYSSFRVLEHVPYETLKKIVDEGNRIITDGGLFVHRIDYSDHFAHTDSSISRINFLQFSDEQWNRIAGNRYMFMNRMRHDDFVQLFTESGHELLATEADVDESCMNLLRQELIKPAERFLGKPAEVLATTGAWILSRKTRGASLTDIVVA